MWAAKNCIEWSTKQGRFHSLGREGRGVSAGLDLLRAFWGVFFCVFLWVFFVFCFKDVRGVAAVPRWGGGWFLGRQSRRQQVFGGFIWDVGCGQARGEYAL